MFMLDRLQEEMKKSLKAKDTDRLNVVRMLISEIKNESFKSGIQKTAEEVVTAYRKRLSKAKEEFIDQKEFVEKIEKELKVVDEFLPKQMSKEEILEFLKTFPEEKTMRNVMLVLKGKVDGKLVKDILENK